MSAETRYAVVIDGQVQLLAPDDPIPAGLRTSALVQSRAVDELTLEPVAGVITAMPAGAAFESPQARAAVNPRTASGGVVGLVGLPSRALPLLQLVAYEVGVRVSAAGYLPLSATQNLGPQPQFPAQFTQARLPDLLLHRTPVLFAGRTVVRTASATVPLAGAVVTISGIWRLAPTQALSPPPLAPELVAAFPPLWDRQDAATTTLRMVTLTPDVANAKHLLRPAAAGTRELLLSDQVAVVAGQRLLLDNGDPWRREAIVIASITGSSSPAEPALVTLEYPLAFLHQAGASAHRADVAVVGANTSLAFDAIAGDTTLLVSNVAALATGLVEIFDGASVPQYHALTTYTATSDADGFWSLPPLSRVALVELQATHGAHPTIARRLAPAYPRREQRADFVFS